MASVEDQYQKAWQLCQGESHNDPDSEPYKSKYAAREIFEELKSRLSNQLDEDDVDDESSSFSEEGVDGVGLTRARMAAVVYHLGVIAVETEEFSTGEEYLNNALIIIGDEAGISAGVSSAEVEEAQVVTAALLGDSDSLLSSSSKTASISPTAISPSTIALTISCHNQLGILWSNRGLYSAARHHLDRADALYNEYQLKSAKLPRTIHSLFASSEKAAEDKSGVAALEKLHTLTYYYLAQVYGHLGAPDTSAWYCHSTLQRQLASKDYDPLEWAINAATLSQFYQGKEKFRVSRHLLASASKVLSSHEAEMNTSEAESEDAAHKQEKYNQCKADVARCWGRYSLVLLQVSCDRALPDDSTQQESADSQEAEPESLDKQLEFLQLEVSDLESEVAAIPVQDFDEARQLFLAGLRWLTEARQYYTLEDHASDHVSITQEMSHLYKALAFFEPSEERRCKMHKRRVDLLTVLIKELNPQYYLNVCRQIYYELAETYSAMMDNKLTLLEGDGSRPTSQQTKKINTLATSSIQHFLHYLDSLKDKTTGEQPTSYPEESLRPALVAWFHLGRLWSKLITSEPTTKMQNLIQSLQNYKRLVEYCDRHPDSQSVMAQELAICREMVQLLPLKVEQYRATLQ
ncbi:KIF-binding protein-like isoform X1 [Eriocheir sinensis]|uniref:KIF-binding protein-like isoform X1 n=1 Tax=Eriocheir sinensis TaxID=95602 RepID=UPI0021C9F196|nr:KIF-binding protein-like isoform X1 [Eriocheir sinensis]XP_050740457.1 KIF-binding protein-like isoform X1 [Eriocheir sinensis]XP_050740458.1 KIF-binding protein-like isoform X1 [Eriocheir sinensis]XP_050740460.1 KIF-binding protein-like isoform X1 [Eriocheir sinensis]XP_050740461.1 KIF-binding protein-like isoform X1 [Eriocheir sinensis]XP_050740462.1 KIF-binding protein-like isoform X1 [Eriocheir sinensis]XP_050740463.1 KIF-binding protein-like isoform X1 [Eriocheir sinensis]XP_05074046